MLLCLCLLCLVRYLKCQNKQVIVVPDVDGKLIPVFEIMFMNTAIRNLIRESKTHQIDAAIQAGAQDGMVTMDTSLLRLYNQRRITKDTLLTYCLNYEAVSRRLKAL